VGGGGGGTFGRRDERQLIASYTDVRAVSVSRRYVYAATPTGISVYDRLFNAWLPPMTRDIGFDDGQITAMAGDPAEDAVWVGVPGGVIIYRPQSEQLQRTTVAGVPELIVFDRGPSGDAYVRASGQWTRVTRIGMATPVSGPPPASNVYVPPTLNDVYARYPGLRSGAPLLYRNQQNDRPLRSFPVVSGNVSPDQPSEVWLGTSGDGLYKVDGVTMQSVPLRFGLLERGVGALALAADGVWAAGLGASQLRGGLTFASTNLQQWRWIDGTITVPMMGMRTTAMSLRAERAWIATDRGVVRARVDGSEQMALWSTLDGLPDERVYAVAAKPNGAWVGTARGLVFVTDTVDPNRGDVRDTRTRGVGQRTLNDTPVYALQAVGDTLWIGSAAGLMALGPDGVLLRPLQGDPELRSPVVALAWSDTVLLAATENAVFSISPSGRMAPTRLTALNVSNVGRVTKMTVDDRAMVLAGTDGVAVMLRTGGIRVLRVPNDIPAPALDVAMSRDWLWIGTPLGLLRIRRTGDGGIP
jgi:ligand-binding sensor domain-containing protein